MKTVPTWGKLGLVFAFLLLAAALAGCGQQVDVSQPPQIVYGQDACDRCKMLINEEAMAAAYWTAGGEARRFDDIGGMLTHQRETGETVATWWVHDLTSRRWLRAEEAHFVTGAGVTTPMGFGIVAFADESAAQALAAGANGAMVMDFSGLRAQSPGPMMMHNDHD